MNTHFQRYRSFLVLCGAGVLLSGCSFTPTSLVAPSPEQPEAFRSQAEPGSIWKSHDGAKTFEPKVAIDEKTKITTADVLSLSFLPPLPGAPTPTVAPGLFAGTIENGIVKTVNGADTWEVIPFPPKKVYSFTADKRNPGTMYATGVIAERGKIFRTKDDGANWEDVYTEPGTGTVLVSLAEHPVNTSVIFAGTSAGTVVKSTNGGDTWKNVGGTIDGPVVDILFDAKKKFVTYALIHNSKMYYSPDGGVSWLDWEKVKQEERTKRMEVASKKNDNGKASAALQKQLAEEDKRKAPSAIVSLTADPTLTGVLWAGTANGLFRSKDFGKFWDEINVIESAKKFPIRALAISPKNSKEVVFAAGHVVYKSVDTGLTWAVVPVNVDREISTLVYDPYDAGQLYFGLRKYK